MSLIGNAVSYIGTGPDKRIEITCDKGDGFISIAVKDNGVELHGGDIQVKNELDKGSTFTFRIPDQLN